MNVIVTDRGFAPDDWTAPVPGLAEASESADAAELPADADPQAALAALPRARLLRIRFESFADGRCFTLARRLREAGFSGRLRAAGHVIADQYAMARRAGFDEVEIDASLAARQPESDWLARADWRRLDYQSRLRAPPA